MSRSRSDLTLGAMAVAALAAVGAALVSQHVFDMQPCPWCVLQRLVFVAIALAAVLALVWRSRLGVAVGALLALALSGTGIAAALWQHFVAASSASCKLTLAEKVMAATGLDGLLPDIFQARATCADAAIDLLGVPYEFWSLAAFAALGLGALRVFIASRR